MGAAKDKQKHLQAVEQTVKETNQPQVLTNLTPQELAFFNGLQTEKGKMRVVASFFMDSIKDRISDLNASEERFMNDVVKKYGLVGKPIILNVDSGEITLAPEPPADPAGKVEGGPAGE